jgi:CubicO group peptidase (beta-lactamase class C family)
MSPDGQMYSTADDMAKFMSLFFRDSAAADHGGAQVLDGATVREMLTRRAHTNSVYGCASVLNSSCLPVP